MSQTFVKSAGTVARTVFAATLMLFGSHAANAVVTGGWERPILESRMDILEAQAEMANVRQANLIMTRKDGAASVTGLLLRVDNQSMFFEIAKIRQEACGAKLYIGMALENQPQHSYRLVVVDHSHETCSMADPSDVHAFPVKPALEVLLVDRDQPLLRMMGEARPVISPQ